MRADKTKYTFDEICEEFGKRSDMKITVHYLTSPQGADFMKRDIEARGADWSIEFVRNNVPAEFIVILHPEEWAADTIYGKHSNEYIALLIAYASLALGRQVELVEEVK